MKPNRTGAGPMDQPAWVLAFGKVFREVGACLISIMPE